MRETLVRLAARCPVAIVSGRDLRDVQRLVGLEQLYYAGSHGFDLAGPGGLHLEHPQAGAFLGDLDRAERLLRERIGAVPGALIERKRFAIAVHYRLVSARGVSAIEAALAEVNAASPGLRRTGGKKIHELRPNLPWDKGKAVHWLLGTLGLDGPDVLALYLGDDETDEDAFAALQADGLGIVVAEHARASRAHFRLHDPSEVRNFLDRLAALELGTNRP
jgi:alpha,alpha-trehalase